MELTFLVVIVFAALALMRGGSIGSLARTRFRWTWALLAGLAIQLGFEAWNPDGFGELPGALVIIASNVLVAAFVVANRKLPGTGLAGLGLALNAIVITLNGAMPVSIRAAEIAGLSIENEDFGVKHERLTDETRAPWFGDVIPVPLTHLIVSVGDVVLALGMARLVYSRATSNLGGRHLSRNEIEIRTNGKG